MDEIKGGEIIINTPNYIGFLGDQLVIQVLKKIKGKNGGNFGFSWDELREELGHYTGSVKPLRISVSFLNPFLILNFSISLLISNRFSG